MSLDPHYPRDLIGYGRHPVQANWPGRARVAVQFVLNYEEGGENCVLHGDAGSEQFLSEIVGAAAYPARHMSMESIYEYGSRAGVWRILREFEKRGLPLTVFGVGMAIERHPELGRAFVELGHEIACHGWRWIHYQDMESPEREAEHMRLGMEAIERVTGERPLGWYTGRDSPNTHRLVAEYGGFLYDSDYYGDDLPFWMEVAVTGGASRAATDRAVHARHQRHALRDAAGLQHGRSLLPLPARRLRRALRRGRRGAEDDVDRHALPAARAAGAVPRAAALPRSHRAARSRLGHAPRRYRAPLARTSSVFHHQPRRRGGMKAMQYTLAELNEMAEDAFVAALSGIFEHSPWVAEAAAAGRPYASIAALHAAMSGVVDAAGGERQLALINAHPELAGKAAVRGELTAESTREQSGAGLDQCTQEEFDKLQTLNRAYREKFGFPFILAVRGYDRHGIIANFESRVANSRASRNCARASTRSTGSRASGSTT